MNIKECLLLVLIPLGCLPVCLCLIVFSLFPYQKLIVPVLLSSVIALVSIVVACGVANFFRNVFHEINQAICQIDGGDMATTIRVRSNLRDVNHLGLAMEKMRLKLIRHQDIEIREKTLRAIEQANAHVAHDIRSPLSSMKAATQLLMKKAGDGPDTSDALNLLRLSSTRLETIANDLLRKHRGDQPTPKTFSIHEVLDELLGEFQASPLGVGVTFKKEYHVDALFVTGSKTGISRAIGNIVKNALEAMQAHSVKKSRVLSVLTVCERKRHDGSNGQVTIRITDTGPGIPADKIPLVLQGGHTDGKVDGHGIGGKVVRDVVEAYKGSINIESELGRGATFVITLPLTPPADEAAADMTVFIPYSGIGPIRVIDDDAGLREQWRLTLSGLGFNVGTSTCWEDFSQTVSHAETVIIDYHFDNSEVDGIEIVRRLKERGFANLVLATAEYWKPSIKEAAQSLGVTLCPKPLPKIIVQSLHPESKVNDAVSILVLDDDPVIRQTWSLQRRMWGVPTILRAYASMEECAQSDIDLRKVDLAFVDKNIDGSAWSTDALIAHLKASGVAKVWISSGEAVQDLQDDVACAAADGIVTGKIPMEIEPYTKGTSHERHVC